MKRNALILASFGIFRWPAMAALTLGWIPTQPSTQADYVGLSFLLESADGYTPLADVDVDSGYGVVQWWFDATSPPGCNSGRRISPLTMPAFSRWMESTTEMACDKASMAQDYWFVNCYVRTCTMYATSADLDWG